MSDMVQQPVIQLVQELTMTAVVEQHDCTGKKKKKETKTKLKLKMSQTLFEYQQKVCHSSRSCIISTTWESGQNPDESTVLLMVIPNLDLNDIKE